MSSEQRALISNSTKGKPILQLVAAPLGPKLDAGSRAGTPAAGHAQASPRKHGHGVDKKSRKKSEGKSKRPESAKRPSQHGDPSLNFLLLAVRLVACCRPQTQMWHGRQPPGLELIPLKGFAECGRSCSKHVVQWNEPVKQRDLLGGKKPLARSFCR